MNYSSAYHGNLGNLVEISPSRFSKLGSSHTLKEWVHVVSWLQKCWELQVKVGSLALTEGKGVFESACHFIMLQEI